MKLQEMIDAAFGARPTPPAPQVPGEAVKEPEGAFAVQADKLESLRVTRLAGAAQPAAAPLLFEVVRLRGHWRTRHGGKSSAAFPDQASAIAAAKKLAIAKRDLGHAVTVRLLRTDGQEVTQSIDDERPRSGGG